MALDKTLAVVDIETDPEDDDRIRVIGLCFEDESTLVITEEDLTADETNRYSPAAYEVLDAIQDPRVTKVGHTTFDPVQLQFKHMGWGGYYHDTRVMAWLRNENEPSLRLGDLVKKYLGYDPDKRLRRSENRVWFKRDDGVEVPIGEAPIDQLAEYNRRDIVATMRLYKWLLAELDELMWLGKFQEELVPLTMVLIQMELAGLPIDVAATERLRDELEGKAETQRAELYASAGLPPSFNVGSGDQLAAYLFSFRCRVTDRIALSPSQRACRRKPKRKAEVCGTGHTSLDECDVWSPPEGFTAEHFGREYVTGYWSVKGRNLPTRTQMGKVPLTESGSRPKVDKATLITHFGDDPWIRDFAAWRQLDKLLTTYLRKFPAIARPELCPECRGSGGGYDTEEALVLCDRCQGEKYVGHRIYGRFNQTGTKTGRLSSSDPNLQNIPARSELGHRVRDLFVAPEGRLLLVGDYSQLEPRLMAHFSQDPQLLRIYREGLDVYSVTGTAIFGYPVEKGMPERDQSKTVFLGTQYGAMGAKLAAIMALAGFPISVDRADEFLRELRRFYVVQYEWKDAVIDSAKRTGYVTTIGGRHRRLRAQFADRKNWKLVGYGERQAVNAVIQGSAGDIVNATMVGQTREFPELRLLAQVHDELVNEVRADILSTDPTVLGEYAHLAETGHGYQLDVPLVFEPHLGRSWASAKEGTGLDLTEVLEVLEDDE